MDFLYAQSSTDSSFLSFLPFILMSNFFTEFPEMPKATYRAMKKAIDAGYKDFAREWGDTIDAIFNPLLKLLVFFMASHELVVASLQVWFY